MRVARITYSPTNAAPSNKSASPSPAYEEMTRIAVPVGSKLAYGP